MAVSCKRRRGGDETLGDSSAGLERGHLTCNAAIAGAAAAVSGYN